MAEHAAIEVPRAGQDQIKREKPDALRYAHVQRAVAAEHPGALVVLINRFRKTLDVRGSRVDLRSERAESDEVSRYLPQLLRDALV